MHKKGKQNVVESSSREGSTNIEVTQRHIGQYQHFQYLKAIFVGRRSNHTFSSVGKTKR